MRTSFWMSGANIKVNISNTKHIRYIHSLLIPRSSFFKRCWIIYSRKKKKTKDVMKGELWSVEQKWEYHGSNLWRKQEREKKKEVLLCRCNKTRTLPKPNRRTNAFNITPRFTTIFSLPHLSLSLWYQNYRPPLIRESLSNSDQISEAAQIQH